MIWVFIGGVPLAVLVLAGAVVVWRECPEAVVISLVVTTIVVACALAIGHGIEQV